MPRGRKATKKKTSTLNTKYDANNIVLDKTYGAWADLRRELSDSKTDLADRRELLEQFAQCQDSQRAYLVLDDYFERLSLSRRDFVGPDWWDRMLEVKGDRRLEEIALLFLRAKRPLPTELMAHANFDRLAEVEEAEKDQELVEHLEQWLLPPMVQHLDAPRASIRSLCRLVPTDDHGVSMHLEVRMAVSRPRSGEKFRSLGEIKDLTHRSSHERELFSPEDWDFIEWIHRNYQDEDDALEALVLKGADLLRWLARWGKTNRLLLDGTHQSLSFEGQVADIFPSITKVDETLGLTPNICLPDGTRWAFHQVRYLMGEPVVVVVETRCFLLARPPHQTLLSKWGDQESIPVQKLSHRLLTHLRKHSQVEESDFWNELCISHQAVPQFTFQLENDTVRLRLQAVSLVDQSQWQWTGHEWQQEVSSETGDHRAAVLDDPRVDAATQWLRRLDWFTPEPGLWVGDANENFLIGLSQVWPDRPQEADYLGNGAFQRLFLNNKRLKPKLVMHGSGIDWLSVSADWEQEGMMLSEADLKRLQTATGRFVKLPDGGWVELDTQAVEQAQETMAELGVDGLANDPQKVSLIHASQLDEASLNDFGNNAKVRALKEKLADFKGVPDFDLPELVSADLRPYQKDGFNFLCHLTKLKLGGILADDMGLGKTLQTLSWLAWQRAQAGKRHKPFLVICPASVLHNWRREAEKFTPHLSTLILESGSARHNLRKQIPSFDIIITNYSILRRDLDQLNKFDFGAIVLDEAQYIKNPSAQVTQSVKQLKARRRLALTGTPLENRLLDLWSIVDFVQPNYLGNQNHFNELYEPKGDNVEVAQRIARKRLSAKLRPLLLRRMKQQVAKDLPDRIDERRDCDLLDDQRKLYLAELRRSRDQVFKAMKQKGLAKSKMHVLAALTRLRQICCHPSLVGNDAISGKTETLFELLEPLMAEGQKVLVFSQFVQMLQILDKECKARDIPTYLLTGETKNRMDVVSAFQEDTDPSVFLLSLRAAGTGLNLTTASYVVLYDPWWNPAVEAQAIDRSHRIGQTQTVNAYRLISPGTVEEKIWELQQSKAKTISDVLGEEGFASNLSSADLEYLFSED